VTRVLLDSNVILYALGGPRSPEAPVDLVQEVLHHRCRRLGDRRQAAADARAAATLCTLHAVDAQDAEHAAELFASTTQITARDAIFAAIAVRHGLEVIVSADAHFDELAQLRRVDPTDGAAIESLAAA
jgi:predicted nucleic acid-binding protein